MGVNSNVSLLDAGQISKRTFDSTNDAIRVVPAEVTAFAVELDGTDGDSTLAMGSTDGTASGTLTVLRADSNGRLDALSKRLIVSVTPVVSNAVAYSAHDQVGGIQTIASAVRTGVGTCVLESLVIIDKGAQSAALNVFFFNASPTLVGADNTAFDLLDANMDGCIGVAVVAAGDYTTTASSSVATVKDIQLQLAPASGTSLYAVAKTTGTPTYTSTSDLIFKYGFKQD